MTFQQVLVWAQGPGIPSIVAAALSVALEYWPAYDALQPKLKRLAFVGLCFVTPMLAAVTGCAMGYQPWAFEETFWPAIYAGGLVAFGIGTLVHIRSMGKPASNAGELDERDRTKRELADAVQGLRQRQ